MRAAWSTDFFFVTVVVSCWDPPTDPEPEENLLEDPVVEDPVVEVNLFSAPEDEEIFTEFLDVLDGFERITR